jgi:hypothetical protein
VEPGPEPGVELRLPSDSLAAATADLDRLQAELTRLRGRHDAARARRAEVAGALADARRDLAELRARQRDRAVQAYVLASSDAALDQLLRPNLRRERLSTLADAADRADRRRLVRLAADVAELTEEGERLDGEIATLAAERRAVQEELDVVLAKVAAASATIGLAGDVVAAGIGPSAIARLARETDEAYGALTLATDPVVAAERAPRYDEARRRLAAELHDRTGVPAERFDAAWVASPVHALRAMYFALSQVGKPYVYATAGPATYDCSGLTKRAWQQNGISIPHFSGAQLHVGLPVSPEALRPGDLLTYGPGGSEHVVMYIGAGYTVEAKGRAWGVVVERADTNPGRFAGASRPLP